MTFSNINKKCGCLAKKLRRCEKSEKCPKHHGPLSESCQLGKLKICKLTGDRRECAKMAALGLLPGQEAELLCAKNGSQCLLKIQGGTLSLDESTSNNIIVESI